LFIGEVLDARFDQDALSPHGMPDAGKLDLLAIADSYRRLGPSVMEPFSSREPS
jgi:hypothetical protein